MANYILRDEEGREICKRDQSSMVKVWMIVLLLLTNALLATYIFIRMDSMSQKQGKLYACAAELSAMRKRLGVKG